MRLVVEAQRNGPVLIGAVPRLEERRLLRHLDLKETAILDIARDLVGIRRAAPHPRPVTAKAHQGADAGAAFMVGDVIGIVAIERRAVLGDEVRQAQTPGKVHQHRLKPAHVAVGRRDRPADRIGGMVGLADRPVKQANTVVAFQIGRVRQDQVGIGHHFRGIGIGIDDMRDLVVAVFVLVGQHLHHGAGVHGGIPRHVRHVEHQRVDLVGIARMGIGDDHVHQPMRRQRVFPGKALVDPRRCLVVKLQRQMFRPVREAQMRAVQRAAGQEVGMRRRMREGGLWIGRLEAEAAGGLHAAEKDLKDMQRAGGLKPVRMRRNAPHGVEADRAAHHPLMPFTPEIGPGTVEDDGVVKGRMGNLGGKRADTVGRDPATRLHRLGRVVR